MRLRIALHVGIRVHALHIPLRLVCREEHAHHRIVIPGIEIIQSRQGIIILPGEAFGRVERAGGVTRCAVGTEELVALERGAVGSVGEAGEQAAQRVGQVERRAAAVQRADHPPTQCVVVDVALVGARAAVSSYITPLRRLIKSTSSSAFW